MITFSARRMRSQIARIRSYAPLALGLVLIGGYFLRKPEVVHVDPEWEKTLISLEIADPGEFRRIGIGFLVTTRESAKSAELILVTSKKLISRLSAAENMLLVYRYRTTNGRSGIIRDKDLERNGAGAWFFHPNADVACRMFGAYADQDTLATSTNRFLRSVQFKIGTDVFATGFPNDAQSTGTFQPMFTQGSVSHVGEQVYVEGPSDKKSIGGPIVYVSPAQKIPLTFSTWQLLA